MTPVAKDRELDKLFCQAGGIYMPGFDYDTDQPGMHPLTARSSPSPLFAPVLPTLSPPAAVPALAFR